MNKVKIIAQSELYSITEIVDEEYAEKRLEQIRAHYNNLVDSNNRRSSYIVDNGLYVTTHLIKGNL